MLKLRLLLAVFTCIVPINALRVLGYRSLGLGYKFSECISFETVIVVRKAHQEIQKSMMYQQQCKRKIRLESEGDRIIYRM